MPPIAIRTVEEVASFSMTTGVFRNMSLAFGAEPVFLIVPVLEAFEFIKGESTLCNRFAYRTLVLLHA